MDQQIAGQNTVFREIQETSEKSSKYLRREFVGKSSMNFQTTLRKIRDLSGNFHKRLLANP